MKYQFIQQNSCEFKVRKMCQVLEVSKSRYYDWIKKPCSRREEENIELVKKINKINRESRETYGSPRMFDALKANGFKYGKNRISRIMRENGIKPKTVKKFKATTNSKHNLEVCPNLLDRKFNVQEPNKTWVSDITYVQTKEGWLYVCMVMDLFSRKIIGWSMEGNMSAKMVIKALEMACRNRKIKEGLLFHSDRGSQYASNEVKKFLKNKKMVQSMSRKGNCWDNAPSESFFKTLKVEELYFNEFKKREEAKTVIFEYIEGFYNRKRIHSTLGYLSPEMYENLQKLA